jgi:tRNA threonylcarbamoyladenosine biosynthesis protein TsaB
LGIILNIETATKNCSVSVADGSKTIVLKELNEGAFSHAEKLHVFIEETVFKAGLKLQDLQAVAVSKGPGSYTGLRIGVSAAKGLCFALDIPLISVATLKSLALQASPDDGGVIVPMLDARRMEVYSAVFDSKHHQLRETQAEIIDSSSYSELLERNPIYFIGDGAEKCKGIIEHKNAVFLKEKFPSAREMAILSAQKFENKDFEDLAYFEPYYLKDFVAGKPKNYFNS